MWGVVVGTRIAEAPGRAYRQADASVRLEHRDDEHATFRGSERPNLTFQHESAQLIDGVIAIEDEPRRMLLRHGLVVLDTLRHIAETALHAADAPLLSVQCPAQLPPTNSFQESADVGGRRVDPARSASIAIRFRIALDRPRADVRLQIADRLARHCEERGLGFWLGDTRPGYRIGNWFLVHPHNRKLARATYRRDADQRRAGNAADGCPPVTFVGPARPGTTHAILSFLGQYPQIGVLACSMTPLDELAFLRVQLAVSGASRARLASVNSEIAGMRATGDDLAEVLPRLVRALLPSGPDAPPVPPPTREHDRAQPLGCGVDGGGQPGRTGADHRDVDHLRGVELLGVRAGFQGVDRVPAAGSSTRPNSATRATCSSLSVGSVSSVRA